MDAVFQSFDERPLGAASIGQVHRVTMRDGRPAVVKVRCAGASSWILVETPPPSLVWVGKLTSSRLRGVFWGYLNRIFRCCDIFIFLRVFLCLCVCVFVP